jgi:hypothetical protein
MGAAIGAEGAKKWLTGLPISSAPPILGNENRPFGREIFKQLRQAIEHAAGVAERPDPATLSSRAALLEILRLVADNLIEKIAGLVGAATRSGCPQPAWHLKSSLPSRSVSERLACYTKSL